MGAVPVTFVGILAHGDGTSENVTFTGMASITGLTVGGGPPLGTWGGGNVPYPEHPIAPGGPVPPLGTWGGGNVPYPTPPIYFPPLGTWGPNDPRPEHPIVIPPPPPDFPKPPVDGGVKPPPPNGGWGYHPEYGWGYFPGVGGEPGPKDKKR